MITHSQHCRPIRLSCFPYLCFCRSYLSKTKKIEEHILRPKMNCGVGLVNCFFVSSPSLPWQHGRRQQGWYIRGTRKKQFTKPTPQLILGRSNLHSIIAFTIKGAESVARFRCTRLQIVFVLFGSLAFLAVTAFVIHGIAVIIAAFFGAGTVEPKQP